ncbi:SIS domain-containing protein [Streptomyces sp. ISL-11]|uniref:SIS domain-containing protein n=1 Tax=Streptomyces sp. ISL-11 TaxID=2819174 RepID=UPI001BEC41CC|nr:SIS domain-containing protein [Streptomyces sp. ISL-11]MBT2383462.1 SIS domain-containing protein [Streptomyces sp. ISL-11]
MPTALHRMINQQAAALDHIAGLDLAERAATLTAARRVIVTGTGTSQHAAELGAAMLERAGLDARWVPAVQWARWSAGPRPGDVLVVITHTAETAFAVRARAAALEAGIPVVPITGAGRGWPEAIETVAPEESETYTVSYTSALGVLARLAHLAGAPDGSPEDLRRTAGQVRVHCAAPGIDHIPVPARSLALIGCGPWGVTAREGALKIREGARILAEGFDSDRFLHGAAVPYTAADGLVLLEPAADADGLTAALGNAARAEGIATTTLEAPAGDPLPPLLAQIPMTVRLQLLADRYAALRGQDPDEAIVGAWADSALWRMGTPGR